MVKLATVSLMVSHTLAMRVVDVDFSNINQTAMDEELRPPLGAPGSFTCPSQCVECCTKLRSLTGLVGGYWAENNRFKCITRGHDNVKEIPGYNCKDKGPRNSHPGQNKHYCRFTSEERHAGAWRTLQRCRDTSVEPFRNFVGPTSCSTTSLGAAISRVTGHHFGLLTAADIVILTDSHPITGGASGFVANKLINAGLTPNGMTGRDFKREIKDRLAADLSSKRLNTYAMAVWAGAAGPVSAYNHSKATEPTRILEKVEIPGWPARSIAIETPEDDMKQIDLQGGLFPCAIERLRGLPIEDNMDGENQWGDMTVPEMHQWFYGRFGTYQTPFHFIVPENEITSDRILEQLVFQNVGAHHLELISSHDGQDAGFINPIGVGGCPSNGLPVEGCPLPLHSCLATIPSETRRTVKFVVRMEGLFDDVPLRPNLAKWGSNAFFDGEGHLLALQYKGETLVAGTGAANWDYFKFVFRSSLVSTITAFDHLVATHILAAETLAIATTESLSPLSGLRMLINPHMVGSLQINLAAGTNLFPKNSLVHRASPFDDAAYERPRREGGTGILWAKSAVLRYTRFEDVYRTYRQFFEELRSEGTQMPELPFFEDGMLIHGEIHRYVESAIHSMYGSVGCNVRLLADHEAQRFIRHFWALSDPATPDFWPSEFRRPTCNALTELLTEVIFTVSGWHRHVGTVADFFRDTRLTATVWKEGETNTRPAQALLNMLLAQSTNALLPKFIDDLAETFYGDNQPLAENFRTFTRRMSEIQTEIERRNQERQSSGTMPYHQMEPEQIEYGVEV